MAPSDLFNSSKTLPDVGLAKSVRESWEHELLVDYTIQVEDKEFKVHKLIMASVSDYFKAMLTGGMVESRSDTARIEGFNSLAVQNIIEYIYTNEISGPQALAKEFLACAVYFQVPQAIEAGTKLLWKKLTTKNCWDVVATFKMYSLTEAVECTKKYMKSNMEEIFKIQKKELHCWPFEHFQIVCEIWDGSELDLFVTIRKWVKRNHKNRKQHLNSLMSHVQFNIMTRAEIESVKSMDVYSDLSWHEHIKAAEEYHNLPTHQKMLQAFRVRDDPAATCFHTDGIPMFYTMQEDGFWDSQECPAIPEFKNGIATSVEFNNFLLVCESYSKEQKWRVFDGRTLEWSKMAKMVTPKTDFALVHDGAESVYALGGRVDVGSVTESVTDCIEKYDVRTNTWSVLETTLPVPLHGHCACLCFGSIYVAGGWQTTDKTGPCSTKLDCFDTSDSTIVWQSKAPMQYSSPCHVMHLMDYLGEEVIVLLNEDFMLQFYNPLTDDWHAWRNITEYYTAFRFHPHSRVLACPSENALYLINFDGDCDCPCEYSDECMGACMRWQLCRDDNCGYALNEADRDVFPDHFSVSEWEEDTEKNWYICAMLAIPPRPEAAQLPREPRGRSRRYKLRKK